ncbi:MAG: HIT family protein [Candidatus Diapherotrites archaeon]|nr:HIT family protein [Candidatus Diapherotrites archaeon]
MKDCIFCRIAEGKIPSAKIYEGKKVLAFLDIAPVNKGHALVIPKKHYSNISDIPETELKAVAAAAKKVAAALQKSLKPEGINILQSNGRAAGQVVMHFHLHVIPRYEGDAAGFRWPKRAYEEGEIDLYRKKISKAFK